MENKVREWLEEYYFNPGYQVKNDDEIINEI